MTEIIPVESFGTIRYFLRFDGVQAQEAILSLGEVYETAVVWLNGQKVGEVICPPYRFYLPEGSLFQEKTRS